MKWLAILAVAAVTACGVDGPPQRPVQQQGISISGHATMGVATEL